MESNGNEGLGAFRIGNRLKPVEVIEAFYERIFSFLRRLTGNEADAEDLTQRTFTRVWQKLESFAGQSSVGSWIHSIAYHLYVDWRRRDRRTEERSDEWWAMRQAIEPTPDEIVARVDMGATVYGLVDGLEEGLRETIHLHYYQELTLQETAEVMGVALSTVKYRKQQALAELQKKLTTTSMKPSAIPN